MIIIVKTTIRRKYMKRLALFFVILISLVACNLVNTPSSVVENYLNNYTSLSEDVITSMETTILNEELSSSNRETYKNVLLRTYENLKYEIKDESIDKDKAEVLVRIKVYDLNKSDQDAREYLNEHPQDFEDVNHIFMEDEFNNYRLKSMLTTNDIVEYDIKFKLTKVDNEWILDPLDRTSLEKIHGLYNE